MYITTLPAGTGVQESEMGKESDGGRLDPHHASSSTWLNASRRRAWKLSVDSPKLSDLEMSTVVVLISPHGNRTQLQGV